MGRIIGLDLGSKTCGVAISDKSCFIARSLTTIRFESDDYDDCFDQILALLDKEEIHEVVLGLPKHMNGDIGIGHVRYSTTGESVAENAQPLVLSYIKGSLALAHNGNLVNTEALKWELIQTGAIFHTTTDSEVIAFHIARERVHSATVEEAVHKTVEKIRGGYALVIMSPRKLIGARDPYGLKPLCLGKRDNAYVLASESCALTSVGAEFIRDIEPGEIVTITKNGLKSSKLTEKKKHAHCVFEYIYFARLDSTMDGVKIYDARIRGGKSLAKSYPVEADLVTGVPESGLPAAKGYSEESGIPFGFAFYKNSYIGRTFIKPTQQERESSVHLKLSVLESVVKGKRIVLVDDSIVRGTTIANLIHMLKEAGAKRAVLLNVSGPFHSSLLTGAGEKLKPVLEGLTISEPQIPYVANVNASYITKKEDIEPLLIKQVSNSVRWQQSVEAMVEDGVDTFIEIGPGRTLAGFNKKIGKKLGKELTTYTVGTMEDIDKVVEALA